MTLERFSETFLFGLTNICPHVRVISVTFSSNRGLGHVTPGVQVLLRTTAKNTQESGDGCIVALFLT